MSITGGGTRDVVGVDIETPPAQGMGAGLGSSLTVSLPTPPAAGGSIQP